MENKKQVKQLIVRFFFVIGFFIVSQLGMTSLSIVAQSNQAKHQGMTLVQYVLVIGLGVVSIGLFYWAGKRLHLLQENIFKVFAQHWQIILGVAVLARVMAIVFGILMMRQGSTGTANDQAIRAMSQYTNPYLLFFFVSFAAPFMEEFVFRGAIIGYWLKAYPWVAWLFSSLVFGALHGPTDFLSWVVYVAMGLMFGWVYVRTQRLEASMWVHFLNNILGGIAILLSSF